MSKFHDFLYQCAISPLQISKKKHFATFDFFVKMKLVSTVWVSTSLSKSGYWKSGHVCVELYHGQKKHGLGLKLFAEQGLQCPGF